ncbi:hypothetical protein RhiirC2_801707 [Rhizophagus irregularis]|uniref:Uncharacterized protein n=1 Tax=Rhizophagus irregularis TaxID=588596 RepID=A0A2N1M234_9GLOM|nr:hypothetical protein RhiirC2_801707 [Rhizophagus irregularis]
MVPSWIFESHAQKIGQNYGKEEKHFQILNRQPRGTEWQNLHHKTWNSNNCRQARPPT